jgi:hypothetical protein
VFQAPFTTATGMTRFLHGNMRRKRDFMVCSEGPEGSGKSTTTGNLALALNPRFDVERDTIMNLDQLLEVLRHGPRYHVYDLDEAVNIFHNQDWATWEAKQLTKVIRQMRIKRCTWILNVPDFDGLHPYLRDFRIRLRLYHQPVWDADGMGNAPAKVLWKSEWFGFKEQRVMHRWSHLFDLEVDSLDDDPNWRPYEDKKEANFHELVDAIMARRAAEKRKTQPKTKKAAKNGSLKQAPPTTT